MTRPRRAGASIEKVVNLTEEGRDLIAAWATEQGMSFSGAIESLARLGLGQAVDVALAPGIISVIRREIATSQGRIVNLLLFAITEAGLGTRLSAAIMNYQRRGEDGVYERILAKARTSSRRSLKRGSIAAIIKEIQSYGDCEGELPGAEIWQGGEGNGPGL